MTRIHAIIIVLAMFGSACKKEDAATAPATTKSPAVASRIQITVTEKGFEPEVVAVPAGTPVALVFERKTEQTCAKDLVLTMDDGKKVERELPLNTPVEILTTFTKAGKLDYACGMDMIKGSILVQSH